MSSTWSTLMSNSSSSSSNSTTSPPAPGAPAQGNTPAPISNFFSSFASSTSQNAQGTSSSSVNSSVGPTVAQMLNGLDDDMNGGAGVDDVSTVMRHPWDPSHCADWDQHTPNVTCLSRIKRDILSVYRDPPPGMFIAPDPENITKIHALIVGPFDTPYEGGFFYFLIRCPPDYPIRPPRCRLMTTGNNTVRFNPNLYRNGKVCLSILGTWSGPAWSPAQCISSLLISIQSLMSEKPYHNEPGFEHERTSGDSKTYNEIIKHETLRVAVCEMLENENSCPKQLREVLIKQFNEFYESYVETCNDNLHKDGQQMADPFGDRRGQFEYSAILNRLKKLHVKYGTSRVESNNNASASSSSSTTTANNKTHPPPEPAVRKILEGAEMYDSNPTSSNNASNDDVNTSFDDIFDPPEDPDEDDASSMNDSDTGEQEGVADVMGDEITTTTMKEEKEKVGKQETTM